MSSDSLLGSAENAGAVSNRAAKKVASRFIDDGEMSLTPWLTGTGSRRLEGTNSGHKNAEGMPAVGVRVEPPVRLGSAGTVVELKNHYGTEMPRLSR